MQHVQLLLLDSDANFRRALAIALRLDGVSVHEAEDLAAADALLAKHDFDALVLHLTPVGAHAAFIAHLQRQRPSCRVVVCNAHPEVLDAARGAFCGPVLELLRPFRAEDLLDRLAASPIEKAPA